jgi:hypothetical protein
MSKATQSLTLTADQVNALWEHCVLTTYSDGFTVSREMTALCKLLADQRPVFDRLRCLTRADERERAAIYGASTKAQPARRAAA